MLFNFLLPFITFGCFLVATAQADNNGGLKVADDFFAYTGKLEGDVKIWRGIQYAKAPTPQEGLRFKLPQDPNKNQGDRNAFDVRYIAGETRKALTTAE